MGKDDVPKAEIGPLLPHPVKVSSLYLSESEISKSQYRRFLEENPFWKKDNLEELVRQGLVTDAYLQDWPAHGLSPEQEALPVVNVSHPAATAFCSWISSRLPSVLPGFQARLPREAEWEWAARAGSGKNTVASDAEARFLRPGVNGPGPIAKSRPNPFGLRDMAGNVWEWCENGYAPAQYFFPDKKPGNAAEYAVRGGSWANEKETVPPYARGSQPPSWCTPYLGFRVLLGRVTNGSGRD